MKKGFIFATTLAMVLGVGVAVGAHQAQAKPAEAANTTIYLKPGVWNTDSAKFFIWNWSNDNDGVTVAMSEVPTDAGVFKATIDSSKTNVIFKRIAPGGTGEEWSGDNFWNKTANLVFDSTKPCYTISGWGQSDGDWETYSEPAAASVYKYSLNGAAAVTMTKGSGSEYTTGADPIAFEKGDVVSFLKDDAALEVEPKDDDQYTKVKSVASGLEFVQDYNGILYLNTSSKKLWAGAFDAGYYLMGVGGNWEIKDAIPAPLESGENPEAYVAQNVELAKDAEIKMVSVPNSGKTIAYYSADPAKVYTDTDVDYEVVSEGLGAGNIKFNKAGTYDIYYNPESGWYSLVDTEWTQPVYTMQIDDKAPVTLIQNEDNHDEYMTAADFAFKAGEQVKFFKDGVIIAASLKEDNQYTKLFVADAEEHILEFAEAFEGKPVINVKTNKVWGGQFTAGVYLAGLGGEWNPKLAMPATSGPNEEGAYYFGGLSFVANTQLKAVEFPVDNSELTWYNAVANQVHADEGITYEVVSEGAGTGNLKVKTAGATYGVYYNPTSGWYSLVDEVEHVYTVKVGATSYDLVPNNGNEYKLDVEGDKIEMVHGTTVAVYKDGVLDESFDLKPIGNNNLDAESKIIADSEGQIYVDMDAKTLFVGGLPFGGYHLLKSDAIVEMTHIEDYDGYHQYMAASVSFAVNDTIKFIDTDGVDHLPIVWAIGIVNEAGLGANFEVVKNNLEEVLYIKCKTACEASVYMKLKSGLDEVYFGEVPEYIEEAIEFANNFEQAMAESCSAEAELKQAAVELAWSEAATAYAGLTDEAKDELYLGSLSSQLEVREFAERYVAIYQQHGGHWELADFLEWHIEPNIRFNNMFGEIVGGSNTMIIVISIAAASVLAFGIALYLKKRKQK